MPFCSRCGKNLSDDDRFCSRCGEQVVRTFDLITRIADEGNSSQQLYDSRKTVFIGEIRKCPSCGAVISDPDIICPLCGHEFVSYYGRDSVDEFLKTLNSLEKNISEERRAMAKKDWRNWSGIAQFFFLWLNLYCMFIPMIIASEQRKKLTPSEKQKASLIESYEVINEKESIVRLLRYYKGQILFLNENYNSDSDISSKEAKRFWIKLYKTKYSQIINLLKRYSAEDNRIREMTSDLDNRLNEFEKRIIQSERKERIHRMVIWGTVIGLIVFSIGLLIWLYFH